MKRIVLSVLLLGCSVAADAQSALFGKRLVSKGDDVTRVRDIAGAPDKVDTVAADQYSPAMEIWTYRRKANTIVLWIVAGKVVQAQEQASSGSGGGTAPGNGSAR